MLSTLLSAAARGAVRRHSDQRYVLCGRCYWQLALRFRSLTLLAARMCAKVMIVGTGNATQLMMGGNPLVNAKPAGRE
jgi:hypothetical protein